MNVILVGLGKMGLQISKRLIGANHHVVALDHSEVAKKQATGFGVEVALNQQDALLKIKKLIKTDDQPIIVWLMIPANLVDDELSSWLDILPRDAIIIDGGNSDFRDTVKHASLASKNGTNFIDIGTSGGVLGEKNGFSMMIGGNKSSYNKIIPLIDALASPHGGYHYFGKSGSGHYIKMVHNAIEYGIMESLAEGYRMLKEGPYGNIELGAVGDVWQKASIISSDLNELVAQIMHENPKLDEISGYVAESGEARWTLEVAKDLGIDLPVINEAFNVRLKSQKGEVNFATKTLAALRNKFGGHSINKAEQ